MQLLISGLEVKTDVKKKSYLYFNVLFFLPGAESPSLIVKGWRAGWGRILAPAFKAGARWHPVAFLEDAGMAAQLMQHLAISANLHEVELPESPEAAIESLRVPSDLVDKVFSGTGFKRNAD